jgi:putative flippase GtrA
MQVKAIHLKRRYQGWIQFAKFSFVGILNTLVDFAVLNALIFFFGLTENDPKYIMFKVISFIIAVTNSFVLNKLFVFEDRHASDHHIHFNAGETSKFFGVSLAGLLLNTLISYGVFAIGHTLVPNISTTLLANIGALAGTCIVLVSNFVAYKYFVFKHND